MTPGDAHEALRQFERDAVGACLLTAVAALLVTRGRLDAFFGVLGGGLLIGLSYWVIKGAADAVAARPPGPEQQADPPAADPPTEQGVVPPPAARDPPSEPALGAARRAWLAVKFFTRYALLAVAAYVMLTCFRLHPVGVLAGATSPFLAAVVQLGRLGRARARRRNP